MATTRLLLKDPSSKGVTRIICVLTDGRETRIKIQSDYSVQPKHWGKNQNVLSANPNAVDMNAHLLAFKNKVLNIYQAAKAEGLKATPEYIREQLKPKEEIKSSSKEFWQVWGYYLSLKESTYKTRTFAHFKVIEGHLKKFEAETKTPLSLGAITTETLSRLQEYLFLKGNKGEGLNTQTTAKYLKVFRLFLGWAAKHRYTENISYKDFKPLQQPDILKVVLTPEDVDKIRKADLKGKNYLNNVRDLLILSTLTGLRFSDYSRIKHEHLKGGVLHIRQEKTGDFVELPLIPEAEAIVKKLIQGEIHPVSNQKMNDYVKDLAELAKIDEPFEVHEFKGKLKVTKSIPKYKLITTHTGRRTFATNLMMRGIPAVTVMKFTGHKDYKSFSKYINIPKQAEMDIVKLALMGS